MASNTSQIVLFILDGCGHSDKKQFNAVADAKVPIWDDLWSKTSLEKCLIETSGESVGLPDGQMGNSEVGHTTIGAGRPIFQSLTRINKSIQDQSFHSNSAYCNSIDKAIKNNGCVHIIGLLSRGGVHSHENHINELITLAASRGAKEIKVHAILDGRDTPPKSAKESLTKTESICRKFGIAKIVSIIGRYYAMDRDNRWERTQKAYKLIATGESEYVAGSAIEALESAYARGETDEFVQATQISETKNKYVIKKIDAVIFANFRPDRARQLAHAFVDEKFESFDRGCNAKLNNFVMTTDYGSGIKISCAFPKIKLKNCLGEVLEQNNRKQLRIAETEKYAHVTFFLNGGREMTYEGEDRMLIASPKVSTYDMQPEMSGDKVTEELIKAIRSQKYDVIICNYANCDMVGHTGNYQAAIKSVEAVQKFVEMALAELSKNNGEALITADHGNVEIMFDKITQQAHTQHTTLPVPLIYYGSRKISLKKTGSLADIAPTILDMLNIKKPTEMTGSTLIDNN